MFEFSCVIHRANTETPQATDNMWISNINFTPTLRFGNVYPTCLGTPWLFTVSTTSYLGLCAFGKKKVYKKLLSVKSPVY